MVAIRSGGLVQFYFGFNGNKREKRFSLCSVLKCASEGYFVIELSSFGHLVPFVVGNVEGGVCEVRFAVNVAEIDNNLNFILVEAIDVVLQKWVE